VKKGYFERIEKVVDVITMTFNFQRVIRETKGMIASRIDSGFQSMNYCPEIKKVRNATKQDRLRRELRKGRSSRGKWDETIGNRFVQLGPQRDRIALQAVVARTNNHAKPGSGRTDEKTNMAHCLRSQINEVAYPRLEYDLTITLR
jgi:hypothetical protein